MSSRPRPAARMAEVMRRIGRARRRCSRSPRPASRKLATTLRTRFRRSCSSAPAVRAPAGTATTSRRSESGTATSTAKRSLPSNHLIVRPRPGPRPDRPVPAVARPPRSRALSEARTTTVRLASSSTTAASAGKLAGTSIPQPSSERYSTATMCPVLPPSPCTGTTSTWLSFPVRGSAIGSFVEVGPSPGSRAAQSTPDRRGPSDGGTSEQISSPAGPRRCRWPKAPISDPRPAKATSQRAASSARTAGWAANGPRKAMGCPSSSESVAAASSPPARSEDTTRCRSLLKLAMVVVTTNPPSATTETPKMRTR